MGRTQNSVLGRLHKTLKGVKKLKERVNQGEVFKPRRKINFPSNRSAQPSCVRFPSFPFLFFFLPANSSPSSCGACSMCYTCGYFCTCALPLLLPTTTTTATIKWRNWSLFKAFWPWSEMGRELTGILLPVGTPGMVWRVNKMPIRLGENCLKKAGGWRREGPSSLKKEMILIESKCADSKVHWGYEITMPSG